MEKNNQLLESETLQKKLIDFLIQFSFVFEEDWNYTYHFIKNDLNDTISPLSDTQENSKNLNKLREMYFELIKELSITGKFEGHFKFEEVQNDFSKFLFMNRHL